MTMVQEYRFRVPQISQSSFMKLYDFYRTKVSLKYIGGYIREVATVRWGSFSKGLRCYLMTFLALGLVEGCVRLS